MRRKKKNRFLLYTMVFAAVFTLCSAAWLIWRSKPQPVLNTLHMVIWTPVIDPGHGGEDGGAVSPQGDKESALNLKIAQKTELILRFYGITPVMTRTEDISIHDKTAVTLREKKNSDLNNRVKIVNSIDNAVLLSIHQNTFEQSRVFGAQANYNGNPQSAALAELLQAKICEQIDLANTKKPRRIEDTILLMREVKNPAILLECGFLTNPDELGKLKTPEYQSKLAAALVSSFLQWAGEQS